MGTDGTEVGSQHLRTCQAGHWPPEVWEGVGEAETQTCASEGWGSLPCRAGERSQQTGQHDSLRLADLGFLLTEGPVSWRAGTGERGVRYSQKVLEPGRAWVRCHKDSGFCPKGHEEPLMGFR